MFASLCPQHLVCLNLVCLSAFSPGSERKGVRKCAERVEAGLLIHLPSGAETQLWMHKRPWPEGKAKANVAFTLLNYHLDGWPFCSGHFWALLVALIVYG